MGGSLHEDHRWRSADHGGVSLPGDPRSRVGWISLKSMNVSAGVL